MKQNIIAKQLALTPVKRIWLLITILLVVLTVFMTINLGRNLNYILWHRGSIVATMLLVAFAISISTVLFQTITNNKILTPAIMGFDTLFVLIQTVLIFASSNIPTSITASIIKFSGESILLIVFSVFLFRWLFTSFHFNINLVLMVGIIFGTLFRSVAILLQRLMDPSEFAIVQGRMFATFTRAVPELIIFSAVLIVIVGILLWRMRYSFDVLALGRSHAINLGIDYRRKVTCILLLISTLVAISTALVGPLTFLGLMVANLAYFICGSSQHRYILPCAFLLGAIALLGGQLVLEYGLNMAGSLSVVIEFLGGVFFIYLVLKRF